MNSTNRIILNVLATYGRSGVSFIFTLFTARWILAALGQSDFGLYGVVGGVMFFITIVNTTQSATVARFYAFAIGKGGATDNDDLTRLFNSALSIHFFLPLILGLVGYPMGGYAITHWLNVPAERVNACIWVFRFSLASFCVSALSVPYSAMFVAMQLIAQLVLISFIQVFGLAIISYGLLYVSMDRLVAYAGMLFAMNTVVYILQVYFAHRQFHSCKIRKDFLFDKVRIGQMLRFTGLKFLGDVAWGIKTNGTAFVVNLNFGPVANAAVSVANQLENQAETFCRTIANAFAPAITTEEGAGDRARMVDMSLNCCKFGSLLLLLFVIPLIVEIDYWLELWLGNPPKGSASLCVCMLITGVMTYLTKGHQLAIQANGNIAQWQIFDSIAYVITVPIAVAFVMMGFGLISVGYSFIASMGVICSIRLIFARKLVLLSVRRWCVEVLIPLGLVVIPSAAVSVAISPMLERGFLRLVAVTISSMIITSICSWFIVLKQREKLYILGLLKKALR